MRAKGALALSRDTRHREMVVYREGRAKLRVDLHCFQMVFKYDSIADDWVLDFERCSHCNQFPSLELISGVRRG